MNGAAKANLINLDIHLECTFGWKWTKWKLDKLSERQDTPLRNGSDVSVVEMDACDLPKIVIRVLLFGPKQFFGHKLTEVYFSQTLINLHVNWARTSQRLRSVVKLKTLQNFILKCAQKWKKCTGYLKAQFACSTAWRNLWILHNEKRKREDFNDLLITDWFEKLDSAKNEILMKTKNWFNNNLQQLMKQQLQKISNKICQRSRSTVSGLFRFYAAKVHKNILFSNILFQYLLSIKKFVQFFVSFFKTHDARKAW